MAEFDAATLKRLQENLLEILLVIDSFCARHDIEYFLDSGSALGARRHEGFIPWDDDMDIGMFREEYDKFLNLADELPEGYSLHTYDNTKGFAGMFAKVYKDGTVFETEETRNSGCHQAIFVDIFPYDELATDRRERSRQITNARLWQSVSYLYHSSSVNIPIKGLVGKVTGGCCHIAHYFIHGVFNRESIERHFDSSRKIKGEQSGEYLSLPWPNMKPLPQSAFSPVIRIPFEGYPLPVPRQTERYLRAMYGDSWNELPPVEDRKTHAPLVIEFGD